MTTSDSYMHTICGAQQRQAVTLHAAHGCMPKGTTSWHEVVNWILHASQSACAKSHDLALKAEGHNSVRADFESWCTQLCTI
jgi:hypothetical protein